MSFFFEGRPQLKRVATGTIEHVATGSGLPEDPCEQGKALSETPLQLCPKLALERVLSICSEEEMFQHAVKTSAKVQTINVEGLGTVFSELMDGVGEHSKNNVETIFKEVDTDGSGDIDREEFKILMCLLKESTTEICEDTKSKVEKLSQQCKNSMCMFSSSSSLASLGNASASVQRRRQSKETTSAMESTSGSIEPGDLPVKNW